MKSLVRYTFLLTGLCAAALEMPGFGQGNTAFSYQGQLTSGGAPANGSYDFQFLLYDNSSGGSQQGPTVTRTGTAVSNGLFTASLDFGNTFPGPNRWLDIWVRTNGGGAYTEMTTRQSLAPTPYAITASGVQAGGVTSSMLASGAVTSDKIATGAVKPGQIDDGGSGAYQTFQTTMQTVGGVSSLTFSNVLPVTATNGVPPNFVLLVNNLAFGTVVGFSGTEGMSEPYTYVVETQVSGTAVDPDTKIGLPGRLNFLRNGKVTSFQGIVTGCTLASSDGTTLLYTVRIESLLAYMALNTDYSIYQNLSATDVVTKACLNSVTNTPTISVTGSYPPQEFVVQYHETDLNFLNRFMENEGLFYFFNQGASPPAMVVGDNASVYLAAPNSPFPYYGDSAASVPTAAEYVRVFQKAVHQSTLKSTVNAYNSQTPASNLSASSTGTEGVQEHYEYGNSVASLAYDQQLAQVRQGRQAVERATIEGYGTAPDLRAGYTFTLNDQSHAGLSGTYLVTEIHHSGYIRVTNGVSSYFYGNQFEAIPASLTYRPAQKTPRPQAQPCTAVVTGQPGETIHTDKYGRVKVRFFWDRSGITDDGSSAWLRVSSVMAGANHGAIFLPQVGDEVLVSFLEGDPDQPIVIGSLYNAANLPPYALPASKTVSTIWSAGATAQQFNEIKFDDKPGSQIMSLHAAKDMTIQAVSNLTISATTLSVGGGLNIDQNNTGNGNLTGDSLTFGAGSGEGLASQRTAGASQYDLAFYTDFLQRMIILNNGNVGIGNASPGSLLTVGSATCNGTTWVNGSDRNSKDHFAAVDSGLILDKVAALPISEWKYRSEADGTRHVGPVAQDFHAAFGLNGADDKHIATVDEEGVALAAIQGLNRKVESENAALRSENAELRARLERLEEELGRPKEAVRDSH